MPEIDLGRVVGPGVPEGGSTGSILSKLSTADNDTGWETPSELGLITEDTEYINVQNDTDESLFNAAIDSITADMQDRSVRIVTIRDFPALSGVTDLAIIYKGNDNFVAVYVFGYGQNVARKIKYNNVWRKWESKPYADGYYNAGSHNGIFRGKNLGNAVTSEQYAAIAAGTFDDLYIGDYWTINGVNYRIAAFDYLLNTGNTAFTAHHAVIVPDTGLYSAKMNDTNTTEGAYVGSKMYTENLAQAKTTIKAAFSGHVLKHRINLTNATANGKASSSMWVDSEVDLMCEQMVYGSGIYSPVSDGTTTPSNIRVEKSQLPLFFLAPQFIFCGLNWWLRDVITAYTFANISSYSASEHYGASASFGVRPYFLIG